jgi:uncharacterized damage-inducible protein DinB
MPTVTLPASAFLAELEQEAHSTRRLLQGVPADKLSWTPHEKSMSLGRQALHVAEIPGLLAGMLLQPQFDFADAAGPGEEPASVEAIVAAFDEGVTAARTAIEGWSADELAASWRVLKEGRTLMVPTRSEALRTFLFNHLYHHRGQLMVYLRLLDVPLPSIYGPTADEDPFAE